MAVSGVVPFASTFLPTPAGLPALPSGTFDIAAADAQYRRTLLPIVWCLRSAGPIILILGLAFVWIGLHAHGFVFYEAMLTGPFLFGLAGYAVWGALKSSPQPVSRLTVGPNGVALDGPSQRVIWIPWTGLTAKLTLVDVRGLKGWEKLATFLSYGKKSFGVTPEAFASVIVAARQAGLNVEEKRNNTPSGVSVSFEVKQHPSEPSRAIHP